MGGVGFAPEWAIAHGSPWNLWQIDLTTGRLSQLTYTILDGPWLAWSPNGTQLMMLEVEVLYLFEDRQLKWVAPSTAEGSMVWIDTNTP